MRALILSLLSLPLLAEDETDFSTVPPAAWVRFDPTGRTTYDFSAGDCHFSCPVPTQIEHYPARSYLFSPTVFSDTVVVADLTSWPPTTNRNVDGCFAAVVTRVQDDPQAGTLGCYGLSIVDMGNGTGRLQLHIMYGENPYLITSPADFSMDSAKDYRLVLASYGDKHLGRVFDTADLSQPLAEVSGLNDFYVTGRAGIGVVTDRVVGLDVRFDNYLAWDGTLPPLSILPGDQSGQIKLLRDARRSLAARLETTTDLEGIAVPWQPAVPSSGETGEGQVITHHDMDGPARFFRLATP